MKGIEGNHQGAKWLLGTAIAMAITLAWTCLKGGRLLSVQELYDLLLGGTISRLGEVAADPLVAWELIGWLWPIGLFFAVIILWGVLGRLGGGTDD